MKADRDGIVFPTSPAKFGKFIADKEKRGKLLRATNIKAN
jgi:hypothetical protein